VLLKALLSVAAQLGIESKVCKHYIIQSLHALKPWALSTRVFNTVDMHGLTVQVKWLLLHVTPSLWL